MPPFPSFITPASLHRQAEPYKRVLAVLLRQTCVSFAVSNNYLSLAEPVGAVLLRDGRLPERTVTRMLQPLATELSGVVLGCETVPQFVALQAQPVAAATLQQVHRLLEASRPGLPLAWWDKWTPDTPASCRLPPPDMQLAQKAGSGAGERCSMGTLFLQHYLDSLGGLNTFG